MAGRDGRWSWRRGGGYSQLQSESYGPATITSAVMNTLIDHSQGASQPSDMVFLWQDRACYLTPPGAPSSGGPWPDLCHSVVQSVTGWPLAAGGPLHSETKGLAGLP